MTAHSRPAFAIAALTLAACGGIAEAGGGPPPHKDNPEDAGDDVSLATGGTIGSGGSCAYGGASNSGGFGGECWAHCPTYVYGTLQIAACCTPVYGACGMSIEPPLTELLHLPPGCYKPEAWGTSTSQCPSLDYVEVDGTAKKFPGCCSKDTNTCGANVDLSSSGGPNFGCVSLSTCNELPKPCGGATCSNCVQMQCAPEVNACLGDSDCSTIIECAQSCATQSCVNECVSASPSVPPSWDAVKACAQAKCASLCPV